MAHLDSSATKIMMRRPIVCQLYEGGGGGGGGGNKKQTSLKMNFKGFFTLSTVIVVPVYYLSEGFKARLESF